MLLVDVYDYVLCFMLRFYVIVNVTVIVIVNVCVYVYVYVYVYVMINNDKCFEVFLYLNLPIGGYLTLL